MVYKIRVKCLIFNLNFNKYILIIKYSKILLILEKKRII